jgi:Na+-driven multidrug efflux pump
MVGQHLGAGDPDRADESASAAARTCVLATLPLTFVLFVFARPLFGIFTDDAPTIEAGVLYLRIQAIVLAFMALEEVYLGAFAGAGDTLAASIIAFGGTAARIPAAWWLAHDVGLGIAGVWIAIAASTAAKGALLWAWWKRGAWRTGNEIEPAARLP